MKILHCILLGLTFLIFGKTNGQDYKGIWILTHERELRTVNEREDIQGDEFVTIKLDSTEIDTFYYEAHMLLDFIDNKSVIVKGIGGKQDKCSYSVKNGNLEIKLKRYGIKGKISESCIALKDKVSKTETRETFFKRLNESKINDKYGLDSISFINTNWVVKTDTSSHNYGFNFHLLDSAVAIISQEYGDTGYTNHGEWQIDWYKNHLFIGVTDRNRNETKVYHFFDKTGSTLIGNTYEHYHFATEPPPLKELRLQKLDLLTEEQFESIESKLVGKWKAFNNPIPYDTYLGVDTVLNQRYEIDLKDDNSFSLLKSGIVVRDTSEVTKNIKFSGTWELSKTGKYIALHPENSWTRYLTLNEINENYLEFFYDMRSLDQHLESNRILKMKK